MNLTVYKAGERVKDVPILTKGREGSWWETPAGVYRVEVMLPGAPGHERWQRDFTGGCGLFSFVLTGGDAAARARFIDALELFGIGYSWGGYESLVIPFDPARARSATHRPPSGWNRA